jgi:hypothetical protein
VVSSVEPPLKPCGNDGTGTTSVNETSLSKEFTKDTKGKIRVDDSAEKPKECFD